MSKFGCYLNGRLLQGRAELEDGDVIQLGVGFARQSVKIVVESGRQTVHECQFPANS